MAFGCCDVCNDVFETEEDMWLHGFNVPRHNTCHGCYLGGVTTLELEEHWEEGSCHYCRRCDVLCSSQEGLEAHFDDEHHGCISCHTSFKSDEAVQEHNYQTHWSSESCPAMSQDEPGFNDHLYSYEHQHRCRHPRCGRTFLSLPALILHYEARICSARDTRKILNRMMMHAGSSQHITGPGRHLKTSVPKKKKWARQRLLDGISYECPVCYTNFANPRSLDSHLQSLRHNARIHQCLNPWCVGRFSTPSGVMQHMESGKCGVNMAVEVTAGPFSVMVR